MSSAYLNLDLTEQELQDRKARWDARGRFEEPDRVPVLLGIGTRYWLPILGLGFEQYFSSPEVMFEAQVKALRWIFRNVTDDRYAIAVSPDFQNVREASGLGCPVRFVEGFPWARRIPVKDESDLQKLQRRDMYRQGLTGKIAPFYRTMKKLAEGLRVRLTDGSATSLTVNIGMGTDGPFTNCAWVVGAERLLSDVRRRPRFVHSLMDIVTEKIIGLNQRLREDADLPEDCGMGVADDFAAFLSPDQYREFALPYHDRIYDSFGTKLRDMHLCGKIDHLLGLLVDEQRIHSLSGFGSVSDPKGMAKIMGRKVLLHGGPSPSLILSGPRHEVVKASKSYIELLGPLRGYALGDGYNIAPGTPVDHMNALMESSLLYGRYPMAG